MRLYAETESDLIKHLTGKTIAVVGNAEFSEDHGYEIDRHDVVIRFNNYVIKGFEKQVGTKTTIWAQCFNANVRYRHESYDYCWCPNHYEIKRSPPDHARKMCDAPLIVGSSDEFHKSLNLRIPHPSTGIYALNWLYANGFQYNHYGFDGFKTTHYFDDERNNGWHNGSSERLELERLEYGRIIEAVMPYRDEPSRRAAFSFMATWVSQQFSKVHIECINRSSTLNKSQLLNRGFQKVDSKSLVAFVDADMFVTDETLRKAIALARQHQGITYPYHGYIKLNKDATRDFLRSQILSIDKESSTRIGWAPGGFFLVPAQTIKDVGGFDERFIEWGFEDDAFRISVYFVTGQPDKRIGDLAYHLWHETNSQRPAYAKDDLSTLDPTHPARIRVSYLELDANNFLTRNSRKITEQRQQQIEICKEFHESAEFTSLGLEEEPLAKIEQLITRYQCKAALDFGCGTGVQYSQKKLHKRLGIEKVALYDPAISEFEKMPKGEYDVVLAIKVLHHVPLTAIPLTLQQIFQKAKKLVYLAISTTKPNDQRTPMARSSKWWCEIIKMHMPIGLRVVVNFNGEHGPFIVLFKEQNIQLTGVNVAENIWKPM